jgi:hypothetical protein
MAGFGPGRTMMTHLVDASVVRLAYCTSNGLTTSARDDHDGVEVSGASAHDAAG